MKRATFLKIFGVGLTGLILDPWNYFPGLASANLPILILVELKGGNDGLNTLIPFNDPAYYTLRPSLGIPSEKTLHLSPDLGMHEALKPLWEPWQAKDLAWILGVGYPRPNRSHFRSIEIWETGSNADQYLTEGWLSQNISQWSRRKETLLDGIYYRGDPGPLAGTRMRAISAARGTQSQGSPFSPTRALPDSLKHILRVQNTMKTAEQGLQRYYDQSPDLTRLFPGNPFGRELADVARLIVSGVPIPVYRLSLGSFDTHRQQANTHSRLLAQLASGLARLRQVLIAKGQWQRVVVMTYSEFGRRASENASGGTDHGTSAPHLLMGGSVQGGLYGIQPQLNALVNGDLEHFVDFRSIYQSITQDWWGIPGPQKSSGKTLSLFR